MTYKEKLLDPRWQRKRLEILQRDNFTCQSCGDEKSTLHIHHKRYLRGREPWDVPNDILITLCEFCHEKEKDEMEEYTPILIEQIKDKFLGDDVREIAHAFNKLKILGDSHITASLIYWVFSDDAIMQNLKDAYFKAEVKK